MMIWMTKDPETGRITLLDSEPGDTNFPRGLRGRGWEVRRGKIDESDWDDLMAARITPEEQTQLHLEAWQRGSS